MSPSLELRILSGMHQSARCTARHDALVGAHPDCDVILADAGLPEQAARLKLGPDGWDLIAETEDPADSSDPTRPYNQPAPFGPVWITVAQPDDPWLAPPSPPDQEPVRPEPADAGIPPAAPASESDFPLPDEADVTAAETPPPVAASASRLSRSRGIQIGLAALVLSVAIALLLATLLPRTPPDPPPQADPRLAAEQSIGRITAAIEQLGLASRLHVAISPEGVVQVSGWVRDEQERNRLAAALVQIWPMPAMQVSNEAEALDAAGQVLKGFGVKYAARYEGDGRLNVAGIASDAETRSMAMEAVRAQLPGMTVMDGGIQLASEVAAELSRELAAAGLGAMTLVWQRHQLQVSAGALDAQQMGAAQAVLDQFNQKHWGVAALTRPEEPYADAVPFKIRSVVSGETPFLVLEDGTKLLVGGTYQHYRLTKIDDRQLIFEGPRPAIVLR